MKDVGKRRMVAATAPEGVCCAVRLAVNGDRPRRFMPAEPFYLSPSRGYPEKPPYSVRFSDGQPLGSVDHLIRTVAGIQVEGGAIVAGCVAAAAFP
jgi:hypothetical protein